MQKSIIPLIALTLCLVGCGGGAKLKKSGDISLTVPPGYTQTINAPAGSDSWNVALIPDAGSAAQGAPQIIVAYMAVGGQSLDALISQGTAIAEKQVAGYGNESKEPFTVGGQSATLVTATSGPDGVVTHRSIYIPQEAGAILTITGQAPKTWMAANPGVIDAVAEGVSWK